MRIKKIIILPLIALCLASFVGATVHAQDFRSGTDVVVDDTTKIDSTLYVAGSSVTIDAEVNGDVYCAGQTVTINATVHGDVICAAQTLTISGVVDGDVRVAGQSVLIGARVGGSATVAAQTFTLASGGSIGRDLTSGAGDVTLRGAVGRDATLGGETIILSGVIGRNVVTEATSPRLGSTARIGGTLDYTSYETIARDRGAVVVGTIHRNDPAVRQESEAMSRIADAVYWLFALLLVALAFALTVPRALQHVTQRAFVSPWKTLGIGFVASIAVPVATILIAITAVGIPLAIILGSIWMAIVACSWPIASYYYGRLLLPSESRIVMTTLAGACLGAILLFVPFVGPLVFFVSLWLGLGVIVQEVAAFIRRQDTQKKK